MLYVTTREKYDAFTTARTLASDCGPEGGHYLPYKMPVLTGKDLESMKNLSFGQTVAQILNLFFGSRLTGWDVEFCIGRYPVRIASMGQKIVIAECWRNLDGSYEKLERHLAGRICDSSARDVKMTSWLRIAIRIAVLTGVFGELHRNGVTDAVDIAVPEEDFVLTMAVWYARAIGLPIANIICGCSDGSDAWDLIHNGQLRTSGGVMPELERLIYSTLGVDENLRFCEICGRGELYSLAADQLKLLRNGLFCAVVSPERMAAAIPNVYSTNSYILETGAAVSYSALLDYRARTGESRCALLLADSSPAENADEITTALKITAEQLKELLD